MRHFHYQNLTDGRLSTWRHGRAWWGRFHWEWSIFYHPGFCIGFYKGGHHADGTGIAARLSLILFSLYVEFNVACLFGRSYRELQQRDLEVSCHHGSLWLNLWTSDDDWIRDRPWHRNTITLHVTEWFTGRSKCEIVKGEPVSCVVPMPEGSYAATVRPETFTWTWRFGVKKVRESWWLEIPGGGIPFLGKGENSWDCGDDGLCGIGGETQEQAIGNAVASALKSRKRYGETSGTRGKVVWAREPEEPIAVNGESVS